MKILIINGPNLNMLGTREPEVYGTETLGQLERLWKRVGARLDVDIETFQSNHEGAIIDAIQDARGSVDALIINAGAYSHTSYAIHDAIAATGLRTVEVHISNIHEREEWRHHSVISPVAEHVIVGRGSIGYLDAIKFLRAQISSPAEQYEYADHPDGFLDIRLPVGDGPHPVVILVHGGFWRDIWQRDTIDPMAAALVDHGYATVNVEYTRGTGSFPASASDIDAAIDWVQSNAATHDLDPESIVLIGHSAGGYHVLHAAHRRDDFAGSVALAPVTDLRDIVIRYADQPGVEPATNFIGVSEDENPRLWESASLNGAPKVAIRLIHGTDDDVVDIEQARAYKHTLDDSHVVTELEGVGHFEVIDPNSSVFETILEAINQLQRDAASD
jgi:3-dehydroquinate dehydratase II